MIIIKSEKTRQALLNNINKQISEYKKLYGYPDEDFKLAIWRFAKIKNISFVKLSKKIGVRYATFLNWVALRTVCSIEQLSILENALSTPTGYLYALFVRDIFLGKKMQSGKNKEN